MQESKVLNREKSTLTRDKQTRFSLTVHVLEVIDQIVCRGQVGLYIGIYLITCRVRAQGMLLSPKHKQAMSITNQPTNRSLFSQDLQPRTVKRNKRGREGLKRTGRPIHTPPHNLRLVDIESAGNSGSFLKERQTKTIIHTHSRLPSSPLTLPSVPLLNLNLTFSLPSLSPSLILSPIHPKSNLFSFPSLPS